MNPKQFEMIAQSLRQYRRAELREFEEVLGPDPVGKLYVDPLPGNAVLGTTLSSNTTFLVGRKGTGKSTIFAKAQSEIRATKNVISIYLDVKSLYDLVTSAEAPLSSIPDGQISEPVYRSHMLRKSFIASVLSDLVKEIKQASSRLSLWERMVGKKAAYQEMIDGLSSMAAEVKQPKLVDEEVPILRAISL